MNGRDMHDGGGQSDASKKGSLIVDEQALTANQV